MKNKLCLVTGATSGIGAETALALAQQGAHVIVVGRSEKKCITTVNKFKKLTGNLSIDYMCADLSCLGQVRDLAKRFIVTYPRLDVLVNNAGGYFITRQQSAEGYEMNLALNYLSPFLLTHLLIDMLKRSDQGRIVNVSSIAHERGKIHFNDVQCLHGFNGFDAYAQSKLALILFTYELARRLQGTNILVNALHPGFVASNFGRNNGLLRFYLRRLLKRHEITPLQGAKTSIFLASSPLANNCTGGYFVNEQKVDSSPDSYDLATAHRLWCLTQELTGI